MKKLEQKALKICVPIKEKTMSAVLKQMAEAHKIGADLCEIWCGEIVDLDLAQIFAAKKTPLVLNVKDKGEGGSFCGTAAEKLAILTEGAKRGAEYCDLGWESGIIEDFQKQSRKTLLIISHHFWKNTPPLPALLNLAGKMTKAGAVIVKIATAAKDKKDLLTILRLAENLQRKGIRHITILMGEIGKISRLLIPAIYDGEFTFAALKKTSATASGQFTIKEMRQAETALTG